MSLDQTYRGYIAAINAQDWTLVQTFVNDPVIHNDVTYSPATYCGLMTGSFESCPDFTFTIAKLVTHTIPSVHSAAPSGDIACIIILEGTPIKEFLGIPGLPGRKIKFAEHVFYEWREGKIVNVKSLLDLDGLKRQLGQ